MVRLQIQPLTPLVDEFAGRLFGELDYIQEGLNAERFQVSAWSLSESFCFHTPVQHYRGQYTRHTLLGPAMMWHALKHLES